MSGGSITDELCAGDLMSRTFVAAAPEDTLGELAEHLAEADAGSALVLEFGRLTGILTSRDIVRAVAGRVHPSEARVREWMSAAPVTTERDLPVDDAARLRLEGGFHHLPVIEDGRPVGRRRPALGRQRASPRLSGVVTVPLLIAYGSKHGSTQEVAEAIARRLRMAGLEVHLSPAAEVGDVTSYEGVVLGGALYFGCWHPDAARFFAEHRHEFAERPPAIFAVGPRTADAHGLAESRAQLDKALAKIPEVEPRLVAVFGGVVDPAKLRFPFNRLPASDARDWDAIDEWADDLASALVPGETVDQKS